MTHSPLQPPVSSPSGVQPEDVALHGSLGVLSNTAEDKTMAKPGRKPKVSEAQWEEARVKLASGEWNYKAAALALGCSTARISQKLGKRKAKG